MFPAARERAAVLLRCGTFFLVKCAKPRYNGVMNRPDYDKLMQAEIGALKGCRPRLLLHSCCAPCSSACLERLKDSFKVTVFYYNPNIEAGEYEVRKVEQLRLLEETGWADALDCDHESQEFYRIAEGLEDAPEGGARCMKCYRLRLERTAAEAKRLGYEYFATTLTISPQKSAAALNAIGGELEREYGVKWLHTDFKKRGGYLRSCELAREHRLYRQDYCGCEFSRKARTCND